jgi:hypothetical protein
MFHLLRRKKYRLRLSCSHCETKPLKNCWRAVVLRRRRMAPHSKSPEWSSSPPPIGWHRRLCRGHIYSHRRSLSSAYIVIAGGMRKSKVGEEELRWRRPKARKAERGRGRGDPGECWMVWERGGRGRNKGVGGRGVCKIIRLCNTGWIQIRLGGKRVLGGILYERDGKGWTRARRAKIWERGGCEEQGKRRARMLAVVGPGASLAKLAPQRGVATDRENRILKDWSM